ncbi:MFS transporter [Phenylobacterium sp.]|jgi:MFS transporter, PAT family, beta-lactamase induction signal transducer AmpG|uniref:MFS transporter n=1 Tax=Phenylobacterium sp. TaxID=1871053 RepID=UPI00122BE5EE|nr:MFS transporter [Phenylobacterium sp.]THD55833.1 MAG: MFS transporter [Phenylobacterium sp.]
MTEAHAPKASTHPGVYLVLYLPYGIVSGYVNVTLGRLLSDVGATVEAVAVLSGMALVANTWKVAWSPVVDTTLTAKAWFAIGLVATAAILSATSLLPLRVDLLPVFGWLVLAGAVAGTVTSIAVDRLMAFDVPDHLKGQAGGWSQAGNLGGAGLGGGAGLWLATHSGHPWIAGSLLAAISLVCIAPLFGMTEPGRVGGGKTYWGTLKEIGVDLLSLIKTRIGLLACFLMLLPIGSGGLQQLWGAIGKDWNASSDQVALAGGALSGLASIPGCIVGGYIADRIDRKRAYSLFGIGLSAVAIAMALAPKTPMTFMLFSCLYNAAVGFCYGAYSAVTLEAIGKGAAGTKFNLISSLSNVPVLVVTLVDGWAETRFGATGMLYVEAALGVAGVVVYSAVALATRGLSWGVLFGRGRIAPAP